MRRTECIFFFRKEGDLFVGYLEFDSRSIFQMGILRPIDLLPARIQIGDRRVKVHITNLYGAGGTAVKAQHMITEIAKRNLNYNELGIYRYPMSSDSPEMLRTRMDGIVAGVGYGDIAILQLPIWNGIRFDEAFAAHLSHYSKLKKIYFIHDVPPLMFQGALKDLGRYIAFYNRADVMILPSQNMADFLRSRGLTVEKVVIQRMWDSVVDIEGMERPRFRKRVNFAADVINYSRPFVLNWSSHTVELAVTAEPGEYSWAQDRNIYMIGWFNNEKLLVNALRKSGGFGLLWHDDPIWIEYMKLNACCKLGTYLAAGLPVIVHSSIPEADTIHRKNLGLTVDSLEEAVSRIESMTEEEYNRMAEAADAFGELIRGGYFSKKVLTDAVFQLLYD